MKTPLTWIEKVVGIFVVVILALFVAALFATARRHDLFQLTKPFEIHAFLKQGYDLQVGAPVVLNGVSAGAVTAVRLVSEAERDPRFFDRMVRVTIRVEREFTDFLSPKTTALVERPPIGSPRIVLQSDPKHRVHGRLEPGAYIEASSEESLAEKLAAIRGDVEAVKEDVLKTLRDLQAIIANVKQSTDAIAAGTGPLGRAIHDPALAEEIAAGVRAARETLEELRAMAADLRGPARETARESEALVRDLRATVARVERSIDPIPDVIASVDRTLRHVEELAANLREASAGVPEVVRKADRGLEEANRAIEAAQKSFLLRGNLPPRPAIETEAEAFPRPGAPR